MAPTQNVKRRVVGAIRTINLRRRSRKRRRRRLGPRRLVVGSQAVGATRDDEDDNISNDNGADTKLTPTIARARRRSRRRL